MYRLEPAQLNSLFGIKHGKELAKDIRRFYSMSLRLSALGKSRSALQRIEAAVNGAEYEKQALRIMSMDNFRTLMDGCEDIGMEGSFGITLEEYPHGICGNEAHAVAADSSLRPWLHLKSHFDITFEGKSSHLDKVSVQNASFPGRNKESLWEMVQRSFFNCLYGYVMGCVDPERKVAFKSSKQAFEPILRQYEAGHFIVGRYPSGSREHSTTEMLLLVK